MVRVLQTVPGRAARLAAAALALLAGLLAASCGTQSAGAGPGSTAPAAAVVNGTVTAGPSCPVESSSHPCPPRPLAGAVVEAVEAGSGAAAGPGRVAAQARTGHDGSFSLTVPAGAYEIEVRAEGPYPRCRPATVAVAKGARHHLAITCDTGIR